MSKQFFSSLSQNYIEILKDDEYYDITIEVGEDPNVKIFRAHMIILCYRSPFLRRTLASNKKNDSHVLAHIKLSNISPETFQIILKYIYGGIISLNKQEPSETSKILYRFYDPTTWSDDDFIMMKNTLQHCLPLIRFFSLSSDEFVQKIRPYKKLLNDQLYEELICSYLDSNSKPNDNILLPRYGNIDGIIDSKIGSRDGFTPNEFHRLCDDKLCTITLIKVKVTEEIIGGYNPSVWKPFGRCSKSKDSFIFSFKNKDSFKNPILSYVKNYNQALYCVSNYGPTFDDDLEICVKDGHVNKNYDFIRCKQQCYEKK
ncbi:uncharacterized protein OCT59_027412 [Rhizophagus irregularis]|uniref:uncharacterized protein n=1 Tax=Rhizophagus irregularis TaxID=588596 RepID=UPI0033219C53|nr:hypothetical protein OCT59_027412 [Rhizophagus irregularis]